MQLASHQDEHIAARLPCTRAQLLVMQLSQSLGLSLGFNIKVVEWL
jgi:hypothetical protein